MLVDQHDYPMTVGPIHRTISALTLSDVADLAEERGDQLVGVADRESAFSQAGATAPGPRGLRAVRRADLGGALDQAQPRGRRRGAARGPLPVLARRRGAGGLPPLDRPGPAHGRPTARGRGRGAAAGSPPGDGELLPGCPDAPEVDVVRAQAADGPRHAGPARQPESSLTALSAASARRAPRPRAGWSSRRPAGRSAGAGHRRPAPRHRRATRASVRRTRAPQATQSTQSEVCLDLAVIGAPGARHHEPARHDLVAARQLTLRRRR